MRHLNVFRQIRLGAHAFSERYRREKNVAKLDFNPRIRRCRIGFEWEVFFFAGFIHIRKKYSNRENLSGTRVSKIKLDSSNYHHFHPWDLFLDRLDFEHVEIVTECDIPGTLTVAFANQSSSRQNACNNLPVEAFSTHAVRTIVHPVLLLPRETKR